MALKLKKKSNINFIAELGYWTLSLNLLLDDKERNQRLDDCNWSLNTIDDINNILLLLEKWNILNACYNLCQRLFKNTTQPEHKLHLILPPKRNTVKTCIKEQVFRGFRLILFLSAKSARKC